MDEEEEDEEVEHPVLLYMSSFIDIISNVAKLALHYDDDFFDRLSHRYTIGVLVMSMIIVGTKQYVGDPINCWCPAHFIGSHEEYTNNVCWISNTYYVPIEEDVPRGVPVRHEMEVAYYQWVPFILAAMGALYYLPHVFWRLFCARIGLDVNGIVTCVNNAEHLNPEVREKTLKFIVRHMDRYLDFQREHRNQSCSAMQQWIADKLCLLCGKRFGNHMIMSYLAIKCLYIANAVGQLFLLNKFLALEYNYYGIEVIEKMINGSDWKESHRFPRVTMCDFQIRRLGGLENTHRYTVQCALPINLFNEKIFIFLWFWMGLVAFCTILGTIPWIMGLFFRTRHQYIKKYLKMLNQLSGGIADSKLAKIFSERYLRQDGVFVLRLISKNTNDIITTELIGEMWEHFKKYRKNYHPKANSDAV